MAEILITPIPTTTRGGWPAEITAIDPNAHDTLIGTINTPGLGEIRGAWNGSGICRDATEDCNLDINLPEVKDALSTL